MSSIDDRIVNMQFNNSQFQKGVSETNNSLNDLKKNLQLNGAADGIGKVQAAASRFSLAGMAQAVENISSKFSIFGAVGFTVVQSLTNSALDAGKRIAGSLIDPLVQGGAKRALALQQAQFQFRGLGLNIQSTMNAALEAVKGTAFGLDDAATAAAQFGASGIKASNGLESVLRSVAGVAAQTGSSYSNIANIFETVAGNGRLMGMQLTQLSSYGVNAAAVLAKSLHTTEANVRDMTSKGQISFKQFSDAMNKAFGANAAKANETYTGALDNMHAALARIGADVASPYFLAMRDIFNTLGPIFDTIHDALKPLLDDFASFQATSSKGFISGITTLMNSGLLQAIKNIVTAVEVLGLAFQNAFKEVFPADTEQQLKSIGGFFQRLTAALIPTDKAFNEIQRSLAGVFAIFDIIGRVIGAFISGLSQLLGFTTKGSAGFLSITAAIGDWLVKVDNAIKKGHALQDFFKGLAGIVAVPVAIIKTFVGILVDLAKAIANIRSDGFKQFADDVSKRFEGLNQLAKFFQGFWNGVVTVAKAVWGFLKPVFDGIATAFQWAFAQIKQLFQGFTFNDALQTVNTALFGGFLLIMKSFFEKLTGTLNGNAFGIVDSLKAIFVGLRTNLKALEMNTNAKTLKEIAISVALLAASAVALSLVNTAKMTAALGAIAAMMGSLLGVFVGLQKIQGTTGSFKLLAITASFEGIALAILTLSAALAVLSAIPFARLAQAVGAVIVMLGALVGTLASIKAIGPQVLVGVLAIDMLAPAMVVLGTALAILGAIPFDNLARGMGAMVGILGSLIGTLWAIKAVGPGVILSAAALVAMAQAITIVGGAVAIFGALPVGNLTQGMIALAAGLAIMVGALVALAAAGAEVILGAAAMVAAATAITILAGALKIVSTMSWDDIGRSITVLAASLVILAVVLTAMGDPLVSLGALALIVAAGAMMILAPALKLMGTMSWDDIGRGLALLGASLVILAAGGLLMIPASVGFLLLGAAILMLGTGVKAAGEGVLALATGIGILVAAGSAGIGILTAAIVAFIALLPALGTGFGLALSNMVIAIGQKAPAMVNSFASLWLAMIKAVDKILPQLIKTAEHVIIALLNAANALVPNFVTTGSNIIIKFLNGLTKKLPSIITAGTNLIIKFVEGIGNAASRIATASLQTILKFTRSLTSAINTYSGQLRSAGLQLAAAIVNGMTGGLLNSVGQIWSAAQRLVSGIPGAIRKLLGIASPSKVTTELGEFTGQGIAVGLYNSTEQVYSSAQDVGKSAISGLKNSISGISDFVGDNLDMTPTIRPVLDLESIKSDVQKIPGLMPKPALSMDTSNSVANSVSLQDQAKNAQLIIDQNAQSQPTVLNYTQNNTSPKALSVSEIYRNTKNQISTLKGELGVVDQSGSS